MRYLTVAVAAVTVSVPWVAALRLLDSQGWWSVPAWLFVGGKGLMILSTAVATAVRPRLAIQLFAGRYRFDSHSLHGLLQASTRYGWELPQTAIGYLFAQWRVALGRAKRVATVHGVTFVAGRHRQPHITAGLSLGCFVGMSRRRRNGETRIWAHRRQPAVGMALPARDRAAQPHQPSPGPQPQGTPPPRRLLGRTACRPPRQTLLHRLKIPPSRKKERHPLNVFCVTGKH